MKAKNNNNLSNKILMMLLALVFALVSCEKEGIDGRAFEGVNIVGVKINNDLFLPTYDGDEVSVVLPMGRDLASVKLQLLVVNGESVDFVNDAEYDVRKPLQLTLRGNDGTVREVKLRIQSPPALTTFIIEGLAVPSEDIHFGQRSLIVQVPDDTDLTSLTVTLGFFNGTLIDFVNGQPADYTEPKSFTLLGVDETTRYEYQFIITTEEVGPAYVRGIIINGVETDLVELIEPSTLIPHVPSLTDFGNATISLDVGFGNQVDPSFTGENINLLSGTTKVKVTGSDGIEKEFTIGRPKLSLSPLFSKAYSAFNFGANDLAGVAFSGNHIVISNFSATAPLEIGPNYYDLAGNHVGKLNTTGTTAVNGLRKITSDDQGRLLAVPLGPTTASQTVYKWDDVTAFPTAYITYTSASLGLGTTAMRSSGINVTGNLNGDAVITIGTAQRSEVFIWNVNGGVLNTTHSQSSIPYTNTAFYWAAEPMPIGNSGYVGALVGNTFNGIVSFSPTFTQNHVQAGIISTDCKVKKHNGRIYLAYTAFVAGQGARFRICDITDGQLTSYTNPIFEKLMASTASNANNTMDADMAVVGGKLHAVFACTNIGMELYKLEN